MLTLVIGNKLYSSWSMRPWLVLKAFEIESQEVVIPLRQPESKVRMSVYASNGKVPMLKDDTMVIWESLAIIEYLAECYPDKNIWPRYREARAHARSISSEMHSGFQALRQGCPMNLGARYAAPEMTEALKANVDRIEAIWAEARQKFKTDGPFLYGTFTAADAMYAPVVTRLDTYSIPVKDETRAYMNAVLGHPAVVSWRDAALKEPWTIPDYDAGHTLIESYR